MSARAIIGAGGAIAKVAAPTMLQEIAHPRLRSSLSTLYYCYIFAGSILSGIFTRKWRCSDKGLDSSN